jgi:gamma-glutamyl-gamma-aminobutyrate hydrolase PuuD
VASSGSERRPVVGLTTYVETARWGAWEQPAALLPATYVDAIDAAGGIAVLLPPPSGEGSEPDAAATVIERIDALIATGGPDVDPARYGADAHPETGAPRTARDAWELELCRLALERDLPLLAICRGAQVLNVARGGTLLQHVPDAVGHAGHRPAPGTFGEMEVALDHGSETGRILGTSTTVLCSHHQALDVLGRDVEAVGRAPDGTVEAVEVVGRRFALGVQWHPEQDGTDRRLFAALVAAAAQPVHRSAK